MKKPGRILGALTIITLIGTLAHAESIYEWEDWQGITHFGSKPPARSTSPIELDPDVIRGPLPNPQGELDNRLRQHRFYIELMRTLGVAEMVISRERLDALEQAGILE